jgi:hypothetical protein
MMNTLNPEVGHFGLAANFSRQHASRFSLLKANFFAQTISRSSSFLFARATMKQ